MIRAEHIKFDYIRRDGEDNVIAVETAVNDVSFEVKPGEFVAILGHNGSGKSTLARHINALLVPEEGTMYVDGIDTSEKDMVWEIRKRAGMVFQILINTRISFIRMLWKKMLDLDRRISVYRLKKSGSVSRNP